MIEIENQLHPFGDHQTLKSTKQVRHQAMRLIKSDVAPLSEIKKKVNFPLEDSTGCEEIAVVRNDYHGVKYCKISELRVEWIENTGYGIVHFPKSLVSNNFDGGYPSDAIIIELTKSGYNVHSIIMSVLTSPKIVPGNLTQQSWVITQGFEYCWGGRGRCGSILLCPSMASCLVGIHTAGIGERKGFSEMLFRETLNVTKSLNQSLSQEIEPQANIDPVVSLDLETGSSGLGLSYFGEMAPDLKSLGRRWNYLNTFTVKSHHEAYHNIKSCPYNFRLAIHPRLVFDSSWDSSSYENRAREGVLSNVTSIYAYWRGGMRYRFVFSSSDCFYYIQHRFDETSGTVPTFETGPDDIRTYRDLMIPQYATFLQDGSVNRVVTIEVPYYQQQEFMRSYTAPSQVTNGRLYCWLHSLTALDVAVSVYYSFADDTRFSVFQGFPLYMDITKILPESKVSLERAISPSMDEFEFLSAENNSDTDEYDDDNVSLPD